jgi:UrcA family protein
MNTIPSIPLRGLIAAALLSALALSFATVANAAEGSRPPQVIVKFGDLDLSSSQGATTLYRRIRSGAGKVCWRMFDSDLAYTLGRDACLQSVIADAVTHVNQPALSAIFASKYGVSPPGVLAAAATKTR